MLYIIYGGNLASTPYILTMCPEHPKCFDHMHHAPTSSIWHLNIMVPLSCQLILTKDVFRIEVEQL